MKKYMFYLLSCWILFSINAHAAPGEYWELTTSMEGMGMSMPGQTSKECMPLKDDGMPTGVDKDCTISDIKRIPNGSTWKASCKDGSTGTGKQTRTKDTFTSEMLMNTKDGTMKMNSKGIRIGGSCQTDEKMKAAMAQVQKSCDLSNKEYYQTEDDAAAAAVSYDTYHKKGALCAAQKDQACTLIKRRMQNNELGYYNLLTVQTKEQQNGTIKSCGLGSSESLRSSVCKANANNRKDINLLGAHCPAEAKALRTKMREEACSGREFTSPGDKAKCLAGADMNSSGDSSTSTDPASSSGTSGQSSTSNPDNAGKDAVETGKKALKGLKDAFGF
jgi:hypothetical protein